MAAQPPHKQLNIVDFHGLVNAVNQQDLPVGAAQEQINAACIRAGELVVRGGLYQLTFEDEEGGVS